MLDVTQVFKHDGLDTSEPQPLEMSEQFCLDMATRSLRAFVFAPDLVPQLGADLLAVGRDEGFPEAAIYPDDLAIRPQFGAFLLEDQFDPHSSLVHPETNRRADLPAVAPKAIHMGGLANRDCDLRHSGSEDEAQVNRLSFKLFDLHEAIIQGGDFTTKQGHRLDLSFSL
jgi:hypothetical protein